MKGGRTVTLVLVLSALAAYERAGGEFAISMFVNVCNSAVTATAKTKGGRSNGKAR